MPGPSVSFYYLDGASGYTSATKSTANVVQWTQALSVYRSNAVISLTLTKELNEPSKAVVKLTNQSADPMSTTASEVEGPLTHVFNDPFTPCYIRDDETGSVLFYGRVHTVDLEYNIRTGNQLVLTCFDNLQDLATYPLKASPPVLKRVDLDTYDSRSKLIEYIVETVVDSVTMPAVDADKPIFEASAHPFQAITSDKKDADSYLWNIKASQKNLLDLIKGLASSDPHDGEYDSEDFGYDFYLDPPSDHLFTLQNNQLEGAVGSTSTKTITVNSTFGMKVGDVIKIAGSSEQMLIEAISFSASGNVGFDLTVERDYNGTTATTHSDNANITDASDVVLQHPGTPATPTMHYFKRGTRPGKDSSTTIDVAKHGLTFQYPQRPTWQNLSDTMKHSYYRALTTESTFSNASSPIITSVAATFSPIEYTVIVGEEDDQAEVTQTQKEYSENFEIMDATIPIDHFTHASNSTGNATWKGRRLVYVRDEVITNSATKRISDSTDQSIKTTNPTFIYKSGSTVPCATLHYVSNSGSGTHKVMLGNIYDSSIMNDDDVLTDAENWGLPQATDADGEGPGNYVVFEAFPTGTSSVRFFTRKSQSASATTAPYFDLVPDTARAQTKYSIVKPGKLSIDRATSSPDSIRKQIYDTLNVNSTSRTVEANLLINSYPYVKLVAAADNVSRSGKTITFAVGGGLNAFRKGDNTTFTNDPRDFGIKANMVIAETVNNEVQRFAYITDVTSSTIVYGAASDGTDTFTMSGGIFKKDGTALNTSNTIEIFAPLECGHEAFGISKLWDVNYAFIVNRIEYLVQEGAVRCTVEGVGVETGVAVRTFQKDVVKAITKNIGVGPETASEDIDFDTGPPWTLRNGRITAYDNDTIRIAPHGGTHRSITFITNRGKLLSAGCYDYSGTTNYRDITLSDTGVYIIYLRLSGFGGSPFIQATLRKTYEQQKQDLVIGWAQKSNNPFGRAHLSLHGGILYGDPGTVNPTSDAGVASGSTSTPGVQIDSKVGIRTYNPSSTSTGYLTIDSNGIVFDSGVTSGTGISGSGASTTTTSLGLKFGHNPSVLTTDSNSSTASNTSIYIQGDLDGPPGAVGKGRNLVIQDNRASNVLSSSDILEKSRLVLYYMSAEAERFYGRSGSAAHPSYTFANETGLHSGMYRIADDTVGFSAGGAERARVNGNGMVISGRVQTTTHVLIGTSSAPTDSSTLRINEGGGSAIADAWGTWSRAEYKENIEDVSSGYLQKLINSPPKSWLKKPFVSAEDIKIAAINEFGQNEWAKIFPTETAHRNKALWNMPEGEMKTWINNWAESQRVELRKLPNYQLKHIGSIADAESTNTYLPEIVAKDGNNEPEGITVMSYIGILHAAIIELKTEIDALKNG